MAEPWKTIAKVNSTKLTPGQSVAFARGGEWRETLTPGQSGNAGSPIMFTAYGSGAQPIIRADTPLTSWTTEGSIYWSSASGKPSQVWYNASRLSLVATKGALVTGSWWWDDSNLRVYIYDTPASQTISASLADAVTINHSYITVS